jgi:acyl-CoA thioesterase-2
MPADPLDALLASLGLSEVDTDRFEGTSVERERPRLFGGELLAQTLVAASRTAPDRGSRPLVPPAVPG